MKEILLCKYGEIVLKGANRKYFEDMLCREMKKRARAYGSFDIYRSQSTIYIEPKNEDADFDRIVARVAAESRPIAEESEESTATVSKTGTFSLEDIVF